MYCIHCGARIIDGAIYCHSCGARIGRAPAVKEQKSNRLGVAGFVISIVSLIAGMFFCVPPLVGLILSIVGLAKKSKYTSGNYRAVWGVVLSSISLTIWGAFYLFTAFPTIGLY